MTTDNAPAKNPPRRGLLIIGCLAPVLLVLAAIGYIVWQLLDAKDEAMPLPAELSEDEWRVVPWASPPFVYDGPGQLDAYMDNGCRRGIFTPDPERGMSLGGLGVRCQPGMPSEILGAPRALLVHLPSNYRKDGEPLPLVIAFHGFGQRPHHVARALIAQMEKAMNDGWLPPVVLALPDMSLSGNGLDNPVTQWDETGGSWGVNSNLGRFADHLKNELVPFLQETYNVRRDPAGTIVLGASMGGTIALNMMIDEPQRYPNVGAFYPAVDLRYSCQGKRTLNYDPACYKPLTTDDQNRPMVVNPRQAYLFTEKVFLYPVFDSDRVQGIVWTEDKPVWERVRAANPVDRLRDAKPDLTGVHIWYVVGENDDFNIDATVPVFNPVAKELGATIEPDRQIRPGNHDIPFIEQNLGDALRWVAERLAAGK